MNRLRAKPLVFKPHYISKDNAPVAHIAETLLGKYTVLPMENAKGEILWMTDFPPRGLDRSRPSNADKAHRDIEEAKFACYTDFSYLVFSMTEPEA